MERRMAKKREPGFGELRSVAGTRDDPEVTTIRMTIANAYLLRGERSILVDAGGPGGAAKILAALAENGVGLEEISLILLTHGHADHFGGAAELGRLTGAPVAIHEADAEVARSGRNPYLPTTRLRAAMLKPFLPHEATPVEPDVLLRGETSLEEWGVRGRVIETPGHTAGSVSVVLPGGEAIVGDVMMGGHMGGAFRPGVPRYHYFAEDLEEVRRSIGKILDLTPSRILPGHGGPLGLEAVRRRFVTDVEKVV